MEEINDELFNELFNDMEMQKLTWEELEAYKNSRPTYDDYFLFTDYAKEEGEKEGVKKGIKEGVKKVAQKLLQIGTPMSTIMAVTGLTPKQIKQI